MTDLGKTEYDTKVSILSELWTDYSDTEAFDDLFAFADLALPLAFAIEHGFVESTEAAAGLINDTFRLLLDTVGTDDLGFTDINDLFLRAGTVSE